MEQEARPHHDGASRIFTVRVMATMELHGSPLASWRGQVSWLLGLMLPWWRLLAPDCSCRCRL
eukprot:12894616-Prorocentrum_lima.AAC.1